MRIQLAGSVTEHFRKCRGANTCRLSCIVYFKFKASCGSEATLAKQDTVETDFWCVTGYCRLHKYLFRISAVESVFRVVSWKKLPLTLLYLLVVSLFWTDKSQNSGILLVNKNIIYLFIV